jgi:hypothetical protein
MLFRHEGNPSNTSPSKLKTDMSPRTSGGQDRRYPRLAKPADSNQLTLVPKESES